MRELYYFLLALETLELAEGQSELIGRQSQYIQELEAQRDQLLKLTEQAVALAKKSKLFALADHISQHPNFS